MLENNRQINQYRSNINRLGKCWIIQYVAALFALTALLLSTGERLMASNLPASNLPASNLPVCHVEGIKLIKASMSPSQMCNCFQTRLAKEVGSDTDLTDIRIVLRTESAHKVEASITRVSDDHSDVFMPMAIKVHDRPINSSDIQSLAAAVGHALLNQKR